MEVQEDEAYHSGQYLQREQLDSANVSEKHAQNVKRSGPGPNLGTKRQESGSMSKVFGKDEGYKSLEMQEPTLSETTLSTVSRRKGKHPAAVTPIAADTPTTSLAKGLASFNLKPRIGPHQTSIESPSSDYGSGNFSSINTDGGYVSMPAQSLEAKQNEHTSVSQDQAVKKPSPVNVEATVVTKTRTESESMDIDVVGTPTEEKSGEMALPKPGVFTAMVPVTVTIVPGGQDGNGKQQGKGRSGEARAMDVQKPLLGVGGGGGFVMTGASDRERMGERLTASPTKYLKSKSPSPRESPGPSSLSTSPSHLRSESPKSIPSVGENVEIITDTGVGGAMEEEEAEFRSRPEGPSMKRSASYGADTIAEYYGRSSKKTARLDDGSGKKREREREFEGGVRGRKQRGKGWGK